MNFHIKTDIFLCSTQNTLVYRFRFEMLLYSISYRTADKKAVNFVTYFIDNKKIKFYENNWNAFVWFASSHEIKVICYMDIKRIHENIIINYRFWLFCLHRKQYKAIHSNQWWRGRFIFKMLFFVVSNKLTLYRILTGFSSLQLKHFMQCMWIVINNIIYLDE